LFSEFKSPETDDETDEGIDFPAPETLLADLGSAERRALVDAALRRLPDHQRLPLVLYHFEDIPYEVIADRLRVSLAKIKTDIRRGRAALLPLLATAGITRDHLET
jgi:RNA polymerase sigma-70 factor (ECF subfamily)